MHGERQGQEPAHAARMLVIETSHRPALVAVTSGPCVLGERRLDETRRHARDIAPAIRTLLAGQGWRVRDLDAIVVGRGPGSYTGLRVGLTTAKTLAYATGVPLIALETFAAIASQTPAEALCFDVIADAQQDRLYTQRFTRAAPEAPPIAGPLSIQPFASWVEALPAGLWVTGPGLESFGDRVDGRASVAPRDLWLPSAASMVQLALERRTHGERDDPFAVEVLYLRPSSAEEQWQGRPGTPP